MKQVELCKRANVDKASLCNWVKNNWQPKSEAIKDMAKALGVNEFWLRGDDFPLDVGDFSDGYHTFNSLYHQRLILFATIVNTYKDISWKSKRHSDGEECFGGGWFIVGIDTPNGTYTYHYELEYFSLFDCVELEVGKVWDGHTEEDVGRLLSLVEKEKKL